MVSFAKYCTNSEHKNSLNHDIKIVSTEDKIESKNKIERY